MTAGIDDVGYVIDTLYLYMNIPEYTHGLMLLHVCWYTPMLESMATSINSAVC